MRKFTYLLLIFFFTSPLCFADSAPNFNLDTRKGKVSLESLKGKVVYVDFWASWCTPCRKAFPWLNKMQEKYADQGLVIVGINLDGERDPANHFLEKVPASFTIAFDPDGKSADDFKVQVMPSSYLINREGKIVFDHKGFKVKQQNDLEAEIKKVL